MGTLPKDGGPWSHMHLPGAYTAAKPLPAPATAFPGVGGQRNQKGIDTLHPTSMGKDGEDGLALSDEATVSTQNPNFNEASRETPNNGHHAFCSRFCFVAGVLGQA